jgi:hypothetical protein
LGLTSDVIGRASKRYTDAYLVTRAIIKTGEAVKTSGVVLTVLVIVAGFVADISRNVQGLWLMSGGGFILGFIIGIPVCILG